MTESFEVLDLLHVAIEKNDLKLVVSILAENGHLVNKLRFNHTALTLALELKTNEIIEAVMACPNIDVNTVDRFGRTGLYFASKTGPISLVRKLISLGAHINQSTPSILHGCAYGESDNEAIVFALVKHGVNVDSVDERDRTPLYIAVQNSLVNVTKALIKCKANVNTAGELQSLTPLILCAGQSPTSIDANSQERYIRSLKVLNILLENGADLRLTDRKGYTALHHAIENNNFLGTLKLIQWGAQHNSFTAETIQQAFETTIARNHFEIAFFMFLYFYKVFCSFSFQFYCKMKEGLNVEKVKANNFRLILEQSVSEMLAMQFPLKESSTVEPQAMTLKILCRHAVLRKLNYSLFEKNQLGLPTPNQLRRYIFFDTDFSEVSVSLLSDIHIATYTGDIASIISKANQQIVNIPLNDHTLLEIAISRKSIFITNLLLKHGADPNVETTEGLKPLHLACFHGCLNITQCLLEYGADVNALDKHGNLPIHTACSAGHFQIAETLIKHGSTCDSPDSNGRYPIHYSSASGNWKFTKTLLQLGVDANVIDTFGYTGLQLASSRGNLYLLKNIELPFMFEKDMLMKGHMFVLKYSCNTQCVPKPKYSQGVDHVEVIKLLLKSGCSSEILHMLKTTQHALDTAKDIDIADIVSLLLQGPVSQKGVNLGLS